MSFGVKQIAGKLGAALRRKHDYRTAFATPEGQRVLADLFGFCGVGRDMADPQNANHTYYNLGKQRVALRIAACLNMSDADVLRLAQNLEEQAREQADQDD